MKTYVITLSQYFPSTHARAGEPTNFEQAFLDGQKCFNECKAKICDSECLSGYRKLHTIRANYHFWLKRFEQIIKGEACLSVRQWVGKPYGKGSTQREIARLTREDGISIQKLTFCKDRDGVASLAFFDVDGYFPNKDELANNDGLSLDDWRTWLRSYDLSKPMAIIHFTNFMYLGL